MMRVLVCLALGAAAAGCGDPQLARLSEIREDVCACKTAACGEEAMKRVPELAIESDHRSQKLAREMIDCMAKLYLASRPGTEDEAGSAGSGSGGAQ